MIDLPNPTEVTIGTQRFCRENIGDIENVVYIHDQKTISQLLKHVEVDEKGLLERR